MLTPPHRSSVLAVLRRTIVPGNGEEVLCLRSDTFEGWVAGSISHVRLTGVRGTGGWVQWPGAWVFLPTWHRAGNKLLETGKGNVRHDARLNGNEVLGCFFPRLARRNVRRRPGCTADSGSLDNRSSRLPFIHGSITLQMIMFAHCRYGIAATPQC
jgi:hypothetical protein